MRWKEEISSIVHERTSLWGTEIIINKNTLVGVRVVCVTVYSLYRLCALDTRKMLKIMLFECLLHQRHSTKWLNYSLFFSLYVFFLPFEFFFVFDQSFNRRYDGLLSILPFPLFMFFNSLWCFEHNRKTKKMELPLVISFKFLAIVSIMMISKWIKWHWIVHEFFFLLVEKNTSFDLSMRGDGLPSYSWKKEHRRYFIHSTILSFVNNSIHIQWKINNILYFSQAICILNV